MITRAMRTKEQAEDYRYIPDPDIPPIVISNEKIEEIRKAMPESPRAKELRFVEQYGISQENAKIIASELELANAFEQVAKQIDPRIAATWFRDELKRVLAYNNLTFAQSGIKPEHIVELLKMIKNDEITQKTGKKVLEILVSQPKSPRKIVERLGLLKIKSEDIVEKAVEEAIAENRQAVKDYLAGKTEALNFIVGQVMRKTKGRAEPKEVLKLIKEKLKC